MTLQCPGYPEDTLRSLADRLPCRETLVTSLLSLMGQVSEIPIQEIDTNCSFCKSTQSAFLFGFANILNYCGKVFPYLLLRTLTEICLYFGKMF